MSISFVSNYLNHHQLPLCLALKEITGDYFTFVATKPISEARIKLGYQNMDTEYEFVIRAYESEDAKQLAMKAVIESDMVIFGESPEEYVRKRMTLNKLSFRYSERIYRNGLWRVLSPRGLTYMVKNHTMYRNKRLYLLCASAYTAFDFNLVGAYRNKAYKWGYFTEVMNVDIEKLMLNKRSNKKVRILWVGRFLNLKHPEIAVELAERLVYEGYDFELIMVGSGVMADYINTMIHYKNLTKYVYMLGAMAPNKVRDVMDSSDIFLFTSDFNEGWGAVLNESMNSACAVVASHAIGSVPYLIKDGENGYVYENGSLNSLHKRVTRLINDSKLREKMGRNAYYTMTKLWNAKTAAERLVDLSCALLNNNKADLYLDGPCSRAAIIHNNWYKESSL